MELTDAQILARLIGFDSTSRNSNLPITSFIEDYVRPFAAEIHRVGPESEEGKVNLLARFGPEPDGTAGLVLSGHMDVVPAGEPQWKTNPFELTDDADHYYGRGVSDMKGFLAVAMNAAKRAAARTLKAPLWILFTYDEEVGTLGAKRFVEEWGDRPLPRNVIIGEPTSLRVARMHKGHLKLRLTCHGRSAHSGYPHLGDNAIERAGRVVNALSEVRAELEKETSPYGRYFGAVPYVPLNLGTIQGGVAVNIVPELCTIEAGVRLMPGMRSGDMVQRLTTAVGPDASVEVISDSPAMALDFEAPIHRWLANRLRQSETETVGFATDAGWFQQLGMQCALFGPGTIEVAHRPNESLPKEQFATAAGLLDEAIDEFCGGRA